MSTIIGLVGVIGSGKTFQRDLLISKGFTPIDFKDALIDMCEDLVGFPIRGEYESFKSHIIGFNKIELSPNVKIRNLQDYSDSCLETYPLAMTGRKLLQRLGTEVMRKRDPEYWTNAWAKSATSTLNNGHGVVAADVRFPNEIKAIRGLAWTVGADCRIIFCDYKSPRYDATSKHESEVMAQALLQQGYQDLQEIKADAWVEGVF